MPNNKFIKFFLFVLLFVNDLHSKSNLDSSNEVNVESSLDSVLINESKQELNEDTKTKPDDKSNIQAQSNNKEPNLDSSKNAISNEANQNTPTINNKSLKNSPIYSHNLILLTQKDLCNNKPFKLRSTSAMPIKLLLEEIAIECVISLNYENSAKEIIESTNYSFNFNNKNLIEVIDIISRATDTYAKIEKDLITFSHIESKTFDINYVSTTRVGSSNTDIVYGHEANQFLNPNIAYSNQQFFNNSATQSDIQQKALNQGTQTPVSGKSGTKIYSIDSLNFWEDLENELIPIVYQHNDSYKPKHPKIIINKGAGLITLSGSPSQIKRANDYINSLEQRLNKQVQIDVNILSVDHSNINTTGINWANIYSLGINKGEAKEIISASKNSFNYGIYLSPENLSVNSIIQFLDEYGNTTSISNPKVLTLNNQPAIISVGNVLRYTQNLTYQTSTNSSTIQNTANQYPSIFSGVLLDVTPSIKNDEIMLKINPSITATKDSTIENQTNALPSPPNLSVNQISSIVYLKSGQKVILGGLISEIKGVQRNGIPILKSIPIIKYLFSYNKKIIQKREMVIIITPTIINADNSNIMSDEVLQRIQDRENYNKNIKKRKKT